MSNRQVPAVYRSIIDDVVEKAIMDFDEAGVQLQVLHELTRSWEAKVASSRVADFTQDARMGVVAQQFPMLDSNNGEDANATTSIGAAATGKKEEVDAGDLKSDTSKPSTTSAVASTSNSSTPTTSVKPETKLNDDDEINSDLDDSDDDLDDDDEDGVGQGGDLVIALYEKVHRTKNKWKVTLKDGLVSVNGKDYLFGKCNGEFEF